MTDDGAPLPEEGGEQRQSPHPAFSHRCVRGLSVACIVLGAVCFVTGIAALIIALLSKCEYRNDDHPPRRCRYIRTLFSPGIWSGSMFIASGIVGAVTSRRKTTCLIISTMTVSVVTAWVAMCGAAVSIAAHFGKSWEQKNPYPIELHVLDGVVDLICVVCFILSWIQFAHTTKAVCCDGRKGVPRVKRRDQYQPLHSQPMMYGSQAYSAPALPAFQHPRTPSYEPVYLVQNHQIIGMHPKNSTLGPRKDPVAVSPDLQTPA